MKFNIKKAFTDIFQKKFLKNMFVISSFILVFLVLGFFRSFCVSPIYYEDFIDRIYLASLNFTPSSLFSFLGFPSVSSYLVSFDIGQLSVYGFQIEKMHAILVIIFASLFLSVVIGYFILNSHNKIICDDEDVEDKEIIKKNSILQYFKTGFLGLLGCIITAIPLLIINLILFKLIYQYFSNLQGEYYDLGWLFSRIKPFVVYFFTIIISIFVFLYETALLTIYSCTLRLSAFFNFKKAMKIIFCNFRVYAKYICFLGLVNILLGFMIYLANGVFSAIIELQLIKITIDIIGGAENITALSLALILILILLPFVFITISFCSNLQSQFINHLVKKEYDGEDDYEEEKKPLNKRKLFFVAIPFLILMIPCLIYLGNLYDQKTTVDKYIEKLNLYGLVFHYAHDEYGDLDTWGAQNAEDVFNKIKEYLPVDNVCGKKDDSHLCFKENYPKLNKNGEINIFKKHFYKFSLKDGSTGAIYYNFPKCDIDDSISHEPPLNALCGSIWVDINGKKKPNVYGKDLFQFLITKSGELVPRGHEDDRVYTIERHCSNVNQSGDACGAWILYNNNMEYLKKR